MSIIPQNPEKGTIEVNLEEWSPEAILAASHLLYEIAEPIFAGQRTTPYSDKAETDAAHLLNELASLLLESAVSQQ